MSFFSVDIQHAGCVALTDRSDIHKLRRKSSYTFGLSNQMFKLAHSMLQCLLFDWSFLILDAFGSCIHEKNLVDSRCLFDFESTTEAFSREFQRSIVFIDRGYLSKHSGLEIINVFYGVHRGTVREKCINITSKFLEFQKNNKNLSLDQSNHQWSSLCVPKGQDMNHLFQQDPAPGVCKNLYIELKMLIPKCEVEDGGLSCLNVIFQVLEEVPYTSRIDSEFLLNIAFSGVTPRMEFYPQPLAERQRFFNTLKTIQSPCWLSRHTFDAYSNLCRFPDCNAQTLSPTDYITLVHLRMETDALDHWSRCNRLKVKEFQQLLVLKYKSALRLAHDQFIRLSRSAPEQSENLFSRHVIVFLTHDPNQLVLICNEDQQPLTNMLCVYVNSSEKTQYIQHTLHHQGRELEALMDLERVKLLAGQCRTYIGCHNLEKHRGSTFSLLNMLHLSESAHILLDLDDLQQPLQVYGFHENGMDGIPVKVIISSDFWGGEEKQSEFQKSKVDNYVFSPFTSLSYTPVLCVYSYYDGNDKKNNTHIVRDNFAFFLKASQIDRREKWQLIVVHHIDYESDAPLSLGPALEHHVTVIRRPNRGYDFGAWGHCVEILNPYLSHFKYFIFLNSSVRGPFLPRWMNSIGKESQHWTQHVTSHLSDQVKLVGLTVCYRPWTPHVQSMFWATDRIGLDLLIRQDILRPHNVETSLTNVIRGYELEMTRLMVEAGYDYYAFQASENQFVRSRDDHLITGPRPNTDIHSRGSYFGLTPHPFELLFIKTNRILDINVQKLTEFVMKSPAPSSEQHVLNNSTIEVQDKLTLSQCRILIFVMYHDSTSKLQAPQGYPWSQLYKLKRSRFMESQILPHLYSWCQMTWTRRSLSYIGMIPYSIRKKPGNFFDQLDLHHFEKNEFQADFVWFYYQCPLNLVEHSTKHHPRFQDIWSRLLTLLNCPQETILDTHIPFAPCNAFIARPECMAHYVDFGLKAMHWLQTDAQLLTWCQEDSEYKGALSPVECQSIFDRPYYTYEPFIMERLPCYFAWLHKCKVLMKTL